MITKKEAEDTLVRYVKTFVKEEYFDHEDMKEWTTEFIEWLEEYTR